MIFGKIIRLGDKAVQLSENSFVASGAQVIGMVSIGNHSSIWYNSVLRADVGPIKIGDYTNIQDNSTLHIDYDGETIIGDYVTVGHAVTLHNVKIGNNSLIGNGAVILDYAEIGDNVIVGAGTLIPPRKKIPDNSLVMGSPFKIVREVTPKEIEFIKENALHYWELALEHAGAEIQD